VTLNYLFNDRFHGFFGAPSVELAALRQAMKGACRQPSAPAFTLEATWGPRAASPHRVADALLCTARRLQELDGRLDVAFRERRYVFSSTAETVLDPARDHSVDRMVRRLATASRDGIAEPPLPPAPLLGAGTSVVADLDATSPGARLHVHAGHQVPPDAVNHVRLELDASHFLLPDKPLVLGVIEALIDIWEPDAAGLHARLRDSQNADATCRWWLAWKRDGDGVPAAVRKGWPAALPGAGEPLCGGRLWEWPSHAPAALLAGRLA
jgi:hypothetical protein